MTPSKGRAIGYVRVSTTEQAVRGQGLEIQEQAIEAWATAYPAELVAVYRDEGVSGSNGLDSREGLAFALAALQRHEADMLVVPKYDRLSRDLILQETIIQRLHKIGMAVVSVSEPEVDADDHTRTLVRQVLGAIAQYERATIRARMATGKALKAAKGEYVGGGIPLGYRLEGNKLVRDDTDERAQATLNRIRELRGEGKSLRQMAAILTEEGHQTQRGGRWQPQTLAKVLERIA